MNPKRRRPNDKQGALPFDSPSDRREAMREPEPLDADSTPVLDEDGPGDPDDAESKYAAEWDRARGDDEP